MCNVNITAVNNITCACVAIMSQNKCATGDNYNMW